MTLDLAIGGLSFLDFKPFGRSRRGVPHFLKFRRADNSLFFAAKTSKKRPEILKGQTIRDSARKLTVNGGVKVRQVAE